MRNVPHAPWLLTVFCVSGGWREANAIIDIHIITQNKFQYIKNINPVSLSFSSTIAFQPDFEVIRAYNMQL